MKEYLLDEDKMTRILEVIKSDIDSTTPAEVSASTGISLEDCKKGLLELVSRYEGKIISNMETGSIAFSFNKPIKRRRNVNISEYIFKILRFIPNLIVGFLKTVLAILLLVITFVFHVMPLLLLSLGGRKDKNKGADTSEKKPKEKAAYKEVLLDLFYGIINYTGKRKIVVELNKKGEWYRRYGYNERKGNAKGIADIHIDKSISDVVFDFIFGTRRALYRERDLKARAVKLITENSGYLTAGILSELEGYSLSESRDKLVDLAIEFNGEIDIDSNGVPYVFFNELSGEVVEYTKKSLLRYVDEIEPPYLLTGNSKDENTVMAMILTMPVIVSVAWLFSINDFRGDDKYMFYYVVGVTAFVTGMPLVRWPIVLLKNKFLINKNFRRKIYKRIFSELKKSESIELGKLKNQILKPVSERLLLKTISDLGGEIETDTKGKNAINFSTLCNELNPVIN